MNATGSSDLNFQRTTSKRNYSENPNSAKGKFKVLELCLCNLKEHSDFFKRLTLDSLRDSKISGSLMQEI